MHSPFLSPCFGDANALYLSEFFRKVGGFSEDYGITHEDWEFHIRAALAGAKQIVLPVPLFWYRIDAAGMYRNPQMALHRSANLRRHIRPYLESLPHYQGKLVQITQGLSRFNSELVPSHPVGPFAQATARDRDKVPFARVAIIVRTKERPIMLQRALRDILDQSFKDWIAVVVNDGGDTEILELVLGQFADELGDRLLTISNPISLGMQTASNLGIAQCDSDFIVIHDDDDTWDPEFLTRTVQQMDQHGWNPRVAGVVTWSEVIVEEIVDDYEIVETNRFLFEKDLYTLSLQDLGIQNRFPPISFLFRRSAFEAVGRFREEFGVLGDWDFHLRMLEKYELDVIPEPLAGYHHRPDTTTGAYGNSVHAQRDVHLTKRTELLNSYLRGWPTSQSAGLVPVLAQGQLYRKLEKEQREQFQRLHNYLWEIEQRVKYVADETRKRSAGWLPWVNAWFASRRKKRKKRGNLVENGDFREWPGVGETFFGKRQGYGILCPGFLFAFDGKEMSHAFERKTAENASGLSDRKTYLRIVNSGQPGFGKSFYLECLIPDVEAIAGETICVSGIARLKAENNWITIGGRYDLPGRRRVAFPEQKVHLTEEFAHWSCTLRCPPADSAGDPTAMARVHLKLPYGRPFEFEITNIQVEFGTKATEFRYFSAKSTGRRRGL